MSHLHAFNAVDSADSKALKETVLHHITQSCPRLDVDRTELQAQANRLVSDLEMITQWMHAQLSDPIPSDLNAFTDTARSLINALDKNEQGFNAMAVRLVRNSVWLLIYDAFSHLFSMQPEQRPDFQKSWAHEVKAFFVHLPAHAQRMFNDVLSETATEATLRSITQTEWETPSSPLQ